MSIVERIEADFKAAMKAKRAEEVSTLRLVRAALKTKEKDGKSELNDDTVTAVLKTLAKQRQESVDQYRQAGRDDLADKEAAEMEILAVYLPAQVDEATIRRVVGEVIAETGAASMKDMGRVMKESLGRLGAGADGKAVNGVVKELLQAG